MARLALDFALALVLLAAPAFAHDNPNRCPSGRSDAEAEIFAINRLMGIALIVPLTGGSGVRNLFGRASKYSTFSDQEDSFRHYLGTHFGVEQWLMAGHQAHPERLNQNRPFFSWPGGAPRPRQPTFRPRLQPGGRCFHFTATKGAVGLALAALALYVAASALGTGAKATAGVVAVSPNAPAARAINGTKRMLLSVHDLSSQ